MRFIQMFEFTTTRIDEVDALMEKWVAQSEGRRRVDRSVLTADRDRPQTYVQIVEFASYEEAMQNSALPETAELAQRLAELSEEPPRFHNLDLVRTDEFADRSWTTPRGAIVPGLAKKSFSDPDEVRTPEKTRLEVVSLDGVKAARLTLQPGWRWSECIRPVVGTDSCQARHVGAVVSGQLHVVHDDGADVELNAGDAYVIEPGHDAWVTGSAPYVGYEFEPTTAETYAQPCG